MPENSIHNEPSPESCKTLPPDPVRDISPSSLRRRQQFGPPPATTLLGLSTLRLRPQSLRRRPLLFPCNAKSLPLPADLHQQPEQSAPLQFRRLSLRRSRFRSPLSRPLLSVAYKLVTRLPSRPLCPHPTTAKAPCGSSSMGLQVIPPAKHLPPAILQSHLPDFLRILAVYPAEDLDPVLLVATSTSASSVPSPPTNDR